MYQQFELGVLSHLSDLNEFFPMLLHFCIFFSCFDWFSSSLSLPLELVSKAHLSIWPCIPYNWNENADFYRLTKWPNWQITFLLYSNIERFLNEIHNPLNWRACNDEERYSFIDHCKSIKCIRNPKPILKQLRFFVKLPYPTNTFGYGTDDFNTHWAKVEQVD